MIYIVEGSNRVGKTTWISENMTKDDIRIRNRFVLSYFNDPKHDSVISSLSMLDFIEKLAPKDFNVFIDRFHISEIVYGKLFRKYENESMWNIDKLLAEIPNIELIYIRSDYKHLDKINEIDKYDEYKAIQYEFDKVILNTSLKYDIINNNY